MRIIIAESYEDMSKMAADIVRSQVVLKPDSVLGLATGGTPLGMYKELIKLYEDKQVDFSNITTFNLDEYCNVSRESRHSYYYYMRHNFFNAVNIKAENTYIPDGTAQNIEEECVNYEKLIRDKCGIDLQVLGIGSNGHIGFNEPAINFQADTHLVQLDESTIKANSRFFELNEETPDTAISMGIKTILQSRMLLLLANGDKKAEAVYNTVKGKICPEVPASIIQLHPNAVLIIEKNASKLL